MAGSEKKKPWFRYFEVCEKLKGGLYRITTDSESNLTKAKNLKRGGGKITC